MQRNKERGPAKQLLDLTLHPVPLGFVPEVLSHWIAEPPRGMGTQLWQRLEAAREALAQPELESTLPALERALGTALAHYEIYWLERACGLRGLAAAVPELAGLLRHPCELLRVTFPAAAHLRSGPHSAWIPCDGIQPLRDWLRRNGAELRELLASAGVSSYLAALVEATGYCLDHGCGLLELGEVADLTQLPDRAACPGFFDRVVGIPPTPDELPQASQEPLEALLVRLEDTLDARDTTQARQLLSVVRRRNEEGPEVRLLRSWSLLLEGDPWAAGELLGGLEAIHLPPNLAIRLPGLLGWAWLARGEAQLAVPYLRQAASAVNCTLEDVERFGLAAISSGTCLPEALDAVRRSLDRLVPPRLALEPDHPWRDDPDELERLAAHEQLASFLALQGRLHSLLGFPEHALHELELALLLDEDLPSARRWLAEERARQE